MMIAAMAAAVRAASTLRLVSCRKGLSGKSAFAGDVGLAGARAVADGCAAGLLNATGFADADDALVTATGALLTDTFWWWPTE
jgi:hypothetical protein